MNTSGQKPTQGLLLWVVLFASLGALVIAGYSIANNRDFFHDDAWITLRYVYQFLGGHGIVWNPGDYVQGYTNFFFLMLVSGLGWLGMDLQWAARLILFVAYALMVLVMWLYTRGYERKFGSGRGWYLLPVLIVVSATPLLVWALGGLETVLFAFLCFAGAVLALHAFEYKDSASLVGCSVVFALATLTRMDGVIFVAVTGLFALYHFGVSGWRKIVLLGLPALLIMVCYEAWTLSYYGDLLPNTFYAKATGINAEGFGTGWYYTFKFFTRPPFVVLFFTFGGLWALVRGRGHFALNYLLALVFAFCTYVIYVGGDHMPAYRFYIPLIPVGALGFFVLLVHGARQTTAGKVAAVYAGVLVLAAVQLQSNSLNPRHEDNASWEGAITGKYIHANWPAGSLVALHTAGSTPYHAPKLNFIDMLGLNDRHIARREVTEVNLKWQNVPGHAKGDAAYVLSRKPDYIILGFSKGNPIEKPAFLTDLEMADHPEFFERYEQHSLYLDPEGKPVDKSRFLFTWYQRVD